jgi:hypothetical protein
MLNHVRLFAVGALLVVVAAAASTDAWASHPEKITYLTFSQRFALPGAELAPPNAFACLIWRAGTGRYSISTVDRSIEYRRT